MKILLITYYFPPTNVMGAVRIGKLAKYFQSMGHDVHVLTANETSLAKGLALEIPMNKVTYSRSIDLDRIPLKLLSTVLPNPAQSASRQASPLNVLGLIYKSLFTIPDGQVGWIPFGLREGRKITTDWAPDVIYASALPVSCLILAAKLSRELGVPWVGEYRDLWTDSHYYAFPRWRKYLDNFIETKVTASASSLVTVSETMAALLREKYRKDVTVVLNGFDPDDICALAPKQLSRTDHVSILHTGLIYDGKRDPSPLFSALAMLGEERRRFKIHFYGRLLGNVVNMANKYGVGDSVVTHENVSHADSMRLQAEADILLLLMWDHPEEEGICPGKMFEYFGSRRPILMLGPTAGVAATFIRERGAGIVENRPSAIAGQLRKWLKDKETDGQIPMLPEPVSQGFSRDEQFAKLDTVLSNAALKPQTEREADTAGSKRILHIISGLHTGGAERMLTLLATHQYMNGMEIRVVSLTSGGAFMEQLRQSGIPVEDLDITSILSMPKALLRLSQIIREYKPSHIQSWMYHADLASTLALWLSGRRSKAALYWGIRCSNMDLSRYSLGLRAVIGLCKYLSETPDKTIVNSESGLRHHLKIGYRPRNALVIDNGVDTSRFSHDPVARKKIRQELSISEGSILLIMAARNDPMKGHKCFISALSHTPNVTALLVGRNTEAYSAPPRIISLSEQNNIERFLSAADALVSSSLYGEGFSNTILEAMSCGLPVIATDVGDAKRIIGDTGRIIPPDDAIALAEAITDLVNMPEEARLRLGQKARRRVIEKYRSELAFQNFNNIYT